MEETFTIDEIRNYLLSQDSMGDILYNLSVEKINKANKPKEGTCESCGGESGLEPHPCPFNVAIKSEGCDCNCCGKCQERCMKQIN